MSARVMWISVALVAFACATSPGGASAQTTTPQRTSWTSDAADIREGALVTILIDELTVASANRDEYAVNERDRNVGVNTPLGGGGVRTVNDASRSTRGQSARHERFQAEMTAQIVEILPGGVAKIEGRRKLMIDDHEQEVTVRGLVRAQDISSANTVESWRIAQAELLYQSNKKVGGDGSIWSRLLNLIIP